MLRFEAERAEQLGDALAAVGDGLVEDACRLGIVLRLIECRLLYLLQFVVAPFIAVVIDGLVIGVADRLEDSRSRELDVDGRIANESDVVFGEIAEVISSLDGDTVDDHEIVRCRGKDATLGTHLDNLLVVGGRDQFAHITDALNDGSAGPDRLMGYEGIVELLLDRIVVLIAPIGDTDDDEHQRQLGESGYQLDVIAHGLIRIVRYTFGY